MPTDISGEIEGKRATEDNPLSVSIFDNGKVCNNNSTDVLLLAGETYTGIVGDLLNYGVLILGVNADVPSATDGVKFDFSPDGTNWYNTDNYTYLDNGVTKVYTMTPIFRYYRIRYVNGASDQTSFHLQTVLKKTYIKPSSHKIQDTLADEDDGELQVSVLKLRTAQDTYVSAASTNNGNFKISLEELDAVVKNQQLQAAALVTTPAIEFYDEVSRIQKNITAEHSAIHQGTHFNYSDYQLDNAVNDTVTFTFTTPNTLKRAHFNFMACSSLGATLEIYEGSSGVTGGTTIIPRNNNRNSTNTSTMTLLKDPTVTTLGTRGQGFLLGGDRQSGMIKRDNEYVLKQNTTYTLIITSLVNGCNICWDAEWYEYEHYSND